MTLPTVITQVQVNDPVIDSGGSPEVPTFTTNMLPSRFALAVGQRLSIATEGNRPFGRPTDLADCASIDGLQRSAGLALAVGRGRPGVAGA